MNQDLLNLLTAPIPGDHPCGEDMAFSPAFDAVREARREDDPSLAQGEWKTELKTAQWPKVKQLCEELLQHKSKDLQIACWYTEALAKLHGFQGVHFGLQIMAVLLTDFWEFCYPELVPDDLEERIGKVDWLNTQLPTVIRNIPLTDRASGAFSWLKWSESRATDNLALKDGAAKERAVAEGKLTGEVFDKAMLASGTVFYQKLHADIEAVRSSLAEMERHVDERFGVESPGLREVRAAVADCADVAENALVQLGGVVKTSTSAAPTVVGADEAGLPVAQASAVAPVLAVGAIRTRADAVAALRNVAQFFRHNEPHSPVGLLADRAAKWADMPLERWLASVIKDDATLGQLRELLDVPREV